MYAQKHRRNQRPTVGNIRIPKISLHISTKTLKLSVGVSAVANMDEHVFQNGSDLQLSSSTLEGNLSYAPNLAENTLYQQHIAKSEEYDSYSVPQWIGYQQMAPYYVEYLVGNGISNMHGEIPHDSTGIGCNLTPDDSFLSMDAHQARHSRRQHEEILMKNFINTQDHICYQKQGPDEGLYNAAQNQPNMSVSTSGINKSRKTYTRQKATDADRRRRTRIATALDALEDLLPQSKEGNKTNIVDDCIDYIKYLQLHMKELSRNRLVSEPTSNHLTYLEGYGHYLVDENTASGPLQEMVGKLLETKTSTASSLLESRGLFMKPI
ncbi:hypothetical protein L1887_21304 [Cichorium endivia]|nr:hypothetical protein L1887_21304 [Cichorium endivia]